MRSDKFGAYGLTTADEGFYRALRDGFRGAGLSRAQFTQALEWYRDQVRPGMDENSLSASFHEFATNKGWDVAQLVGAQSIYAAVRDHGPDAVTATPTAEEDEATIERANELMRTDAAAYWRDEELQELALEATERQQAAPQATTGLGPALSDIEIEQRIGRQDMARYEQMIREEPGKYWSSPEIQAAYRDAIDRATTSPAPIAPAEPAAPTTEPASVPAAPAEPRPDAV